ncbi:MAG: hypothetical protein JWM34_2426 [Ilumatobacteraceae bacterium]|nr:hypothetical protein [Ilumatobacteraceae bacterium]
MQISPPVGSWSDFEQAAPELAAAAKQRFLEHKHHVLATLRRDGSPRISANEVQFHGGNIVMGMMLDSVKALDLLRDGRCAIHANPGDDPGPGDVKLSGIAAAVTDPDELAAYAEEVEPPPPFHLFRLDLLEVVHTKVHPDNDRLVITHWTPTGLTVVDRY